MLALYFILLVLISQSYISTSDSCGSRSTCKECIRDPSLCVWCAKDDFTGPRCKIGNSSIDNEWCTDRLEIPLTFVKPSQNKNFNLSLEHIIQIKPQKYKMKLRTGKTEKFEFSFQGAKDFPVDLYFLLDGSATMAKIKATAAEQAESIYKTLKNMTNNVYLGFGSFVDKPILPFSTTFDTTKTYAFRHRLRLTDNFTSFKEVVSNMPDGINRDPQEGGLDGLAQVMVCKDLIGWRNESRKIIVYLSDGPYHAAGDGQTAGLFQPYDGLCYTENELYLKEIEMDYPSVGMINKLAVEKNMVILFFVLKDVEYIYKSLSAEIRGSKLSTFMKNHDPKTDETLVKTLKDIYEKISKKITLNIKVKSGHRQSINITFEPDCTSDTSGSECDVEIGKEKKFSAYIKLLEFVNDTLEVDIGIESIEEKLNLEIEVFKNCDCEANDKVEINSKFCNGEVKSCGICDCGANRYGERCACKKNAANIFNDNSTCIFKGSNTECSGHGSCICGTCHCMTGGKFCNCNMESCPRDGSGKLCSGESHGECICGKCKCKPEWKGKACDCLNSDCKVDGKACNNRGNCDCGVCKCNMIAEWDMRDQDNKDCKMIARPDTHYRQCKKLEACALCQRKEHDECLTCSGQIEAKLINKLTEEHTNSNTWKVCSHLKVDIGCYSNFGYRYNDENFTIELVVEQDKNCAETYYVFGGVLLLTLLLVGVGILMSWKLMIDARDRREYKQFLAKNKQDQQGSFVNPVYRQPSSTFNNPAFRKRSFR